MKDRILILTDFYLPGYKSGGAVRTLANMVERMRDEFDFSVVTRNHDGWGDFTPYDSIKTDAWNEIDGVPVYYFGKAGIKNAKINEIWRAFDPGAVFMVSFFSTLTTKTLWLRRFGKLPPTPIVLAPQGELSDGALNLKPRKKQIFLTVAKRLKLHRNLIWKASGAEEKVEIAQIAEAQAEIKIVPDLTPRVILPDYKFESKPPKQSGAARFIFLSRVNRKKNLSFALKTLKNAAGEIIFDVYGAHDDQDYWRECQNLIAELPPNVKIQVFGSIDYEKVAATMRDYHFFVLPTLNENFGHVILEAMASGCPVLLSQNTPWRNLEALNVGWDASLDDAAEWEKIIQNCVAMSPDEFAEKARDARHFALAALAAPAVETANREMLRAAIRQNRQ